MLFIEHTGATLFLYLVPSMCPGEGPRRFPSTSSPLDPKFTGLNLSSNSIVYFCRKLFTHPRESCEEKGSALILPVLILKTWQFAPKSSERQIAALVRRFKCYFDFDSKYYSKNYYKNENQNNNEILLHTCHNGYNQSIFRC